LNPERWIAGRGRLAVVLLMLVVLVAACAPIRIEAKWPALSVVEMTDDRTAIALAYHDRLSLIDPRTGTLLRLRNADGEVRLDDEGNARVWQVDAPEGGPSQFYSSPLRVNDDTLLVATNQSRLFAIDLPTARMVDASGFVLPGPVLAAPRQLNGLVYLPLGDRDLLALSSDNFAEEWRISTERGVWAEPLIHEGIVYVSSLDHHLYAVDAESGTVNWQLDLGGAIVGTPVIHEGRLYVGSFDRKLYEVTLDGTISDQYVTEDWVWGAPTLVDNVLYFGDISGTVYALSVENGLTELWREKVAGRAIRATPVVIDEYVIVGSRDNRVYWLSREDGSVFFFREMSGEILADMLYLEMDPIQEDEPDDDGRYVIVNTLANQQFLVAFTLTSGREVWTYAR
jgi:outer membrane protein assembly factor BamB